MDLVDLCNTWTAYMQRVYSSTKVRYFVQDGKLMYDDVLESKGIHEITENDLVNEIDYWFDSLYLDKDWVYIKVMYLNEVLGLDSVKNTSLYFRVIDLLEAMGSPRNKAYCIRKIKEEFGSPLHRAEYLLHRYQRTFD